MTERELLERFATDDDQEAFRALVERHGPMVLGVCRSVLRDPHDVEDAFQNTFFILARKAGSIHQREFIGPWLHRVALRVALQSRSQAGSRRVRERNATRPEAAFDRDERDQNARPEIREELDRLPERYRLPLILCYLEGKSNAEAALQLRCPIGTVKGRLWRARGQLRDRLSRRGLFPVTGKYDVPR